MAVPSCNAPESNPSAHVTSPIQLTHLNRCLCRHCALHGGRSEARVPNLQTHVSARRVAHTRHTSIGCLHGGAGLSGTDIRLLQGWSLFRLPTLALAHAILSEDHTGYDDQYDDNNDDSSRGTPTETTTLLFVTSPNIRIDIPRVRSHAGISRPCLCPSEEGTSRADCGPHI